MKINTLLTLFIISFTAWGNSMAHAVDAGGIKLLLTSFDPYDKNSSNHTQIVAQELKSRAAFLLPGVQVEVCNLPVVYDKAAALALDCIKKINPDVVVSLGELECTFKVETVAVNFDDSKTKDNEGNIHIKSEIVPGGDERIGLSFPVQDLYCGRSAQALPVAVSQTAGSFICNNTAYRLAHELKAQQIPYTFIHVPAHRGFCRLGRKSSSEVTQTLAQMLSSALLTIKNRGPGFDRVMPIQPNEVLEKIQAFDTNQTSGYRCEKSFYEQLSKAYEHNR